MDEEESQIPCRKTRVDKILNPLCQHCTYETNNITSMRNHYLSKHGTKEEREAGYKFYCKQCDIGSMSKKLFKRHLKTRKHRGFEEDLEDPDKE